MKHPHSFPYKHRGPGITLTELDRFALSVPEGHIWTPKQRATYERRVRELKRNSND